MPELDAWKLFASLGIPGLAFGVFYMLFRRFDWKLPVVPKSWAGPLFLIFMLLVSGVVLFALDKYAPTVASSSSYSTAIASTITYKKEILALRGDFEALEQYPNTATAIEQKATRLGSLMLNLGDDNLDMARRILKYQYGGWAYLIAARVTNNKSNKSEFTELSIKMLTRAIDEIAIAERLHADGSNPEAKAVYEWVTSPDSADHNRTMYLLATAFAVGYNNNGAYGVQDVQAQIEEIDGWYLDLYPIAANEDLAAVFVDNEEL